MSAINGCGASGADALRSLSAPARADMSAEAGPLDPARAGRVRDAIAAGRYPVDPAKLAERLLALGLFPAQGQ